MKQLLAQEKITNPAFKDSPLEGIATGKAFFQELVPNLVGLAFVVGVLIFFFVMATGAIGWITSGGDKATLESARGKITNALVGIIVLFALFALLGVIEDFFGINILQLDIGPLQIGN